MKALDGRLGVIAPMRVGMGMTRDQEIEYAFERGIDVPVTKSSSYSVDVNLWGRSVETGVLGARNLTRSVSTEAVAARLRLAGSRVDVAEVHAPFSHQELIVVDALGAEITTLNPSGGVLPADPLMVSGLIRVCAAAALVVSAAGCGSRTEEHEDARRTPTGGATFPLRRF